METLSEQGRRAREEALAARAAVTMQLLVEHLRSKGHAVETALVDRFGRQEHVLKSLDGMDPYLRIFNEQQLAAGRAFRRGYTGRLRLTFGTYGNTTNLPEPKAGFDVEKVAERLVRYVQGVRGEWERDRQRQERLKTAQAAVEMLRDQHKLELYGRIRLEATADGVTVKLVGLSHEDANRALVALREER